MTHNKIDEKYYINVANIMNLKTPRCKLPRPKLKPTILVNGNEWLPLITLEVEI